MTRKEEVGACIEELKKRIPWGADVFPKLNYGEGFERKSIRDNCKNLIKEAQDLMKYIEEYEEIKKYR